MKARLPVVFVAEAGTELIGFVRVALSDNGPCPARLETLYVSERFRRTGLGQALVDRATEWCVGHGCREMAVDFISNNSAASQFYEQLGFKSLLITYMRKLPATTGREGHIT